jgi:hypothetical protein
MEIFPFLNGCRLIRKIVLEKLGIERFHIVRSKSKEKKVSVVKD